METIITILVLLALSGLSSWLKKRSGGDEFEIPWEQEQPEPPPIRPARPAAPLEKPSPTPRRLIDLEAELRRLLEVETPPPPLIVRPAPKPTPPPPVFAPVAPARAAEEGPAQKRLELIESRLPYQKPGQLPEEVAGHLKRPRKPPGPFPSRERSAAIRESVSLLRSPLSARKAFIVAAILGPPRAQQELPVAP